ncbi:MULTISPECIES: malonyl-CoA decarboxylase [Ensifer]|jgi:malonyl-CoA decarboxylase|uniref:malonyl-CoA decarboxylase n=1 Tax=Ensifer TaxID=106591 RepID=UPI00071543C8|nr:MULTISPECIES: malonyl-CoA decarboxylase [Ensifer]KQX43229.1 MCD, Malonyl-CoA decarboxylase MCD [Ensifer sp. Root1298]KQX72778.1 MCD, Malonyl-CoA decarboxylase MCD [Ensifer sp. Root1312]KRC15744.1 MCD, Malonyl-CoA decarboxylase MCD [Ensifer sp. Root74]KRD59019.1 MCD, Malonyl-CoA decarboxylase MCD [Ensifer sp. Root954]
MKRGNSLDILDGSSTYLGGLLETLTRRGRLLLRRNPQPQPQAEQIDLVALAETLLSRRGEASGVALARELLSAYQWAPIESKLVFLLALADRFGPEQRQLELAMEALRRERTADNLDAIHVASEPRRQQLFRRLNLAPGGTKALIRMREDLLQQLGQKPELRGVDSDFAHLFGSWFNRGFLVLRPIDWTSPANILERIIQYEAVHEIRDWDDLRNRLQPSDRRCYAFFHPQLVDEPLIFVEVALTKEIPSQIHPLLDLDRTVIKDSEATTAVFYSISNTQKGLRGVSFGNFLIKQVVENLKAELPNLKTFVTLSPVPGFATWLAKERNSPNSAFADPAFADKLKLLDGPDWHQNDDVVAEVRPALQAATAYYFLRAKNPKGRPVDPVAQFHLGNGARLEQINFLGDRSPKGLKQSHGMMVNYLYQLNEIEANHEAFAENGNVAASPAVRKLLPTNLQSRELTVQRG